MQLVRRESTRPARYALLDGRYKIYGTIGDGATSKVKLGVLVDQHTERKCAVKILRPGYEKGISKEVEMLQLVSNFHTEKSVNVVRMQEFLSDVPYHKKNGEEKRVTALVLEYVDGCELFQIVAKTGPVAMDAARVLYHQLLSSLEYLHEQDVVHRDLKPQNLLVDVNGALKLTDFGFSTLLSGEHGRGWLKTIGGTEGYMAPEMQRKEQYRGQRSDVFASGVILFFMATGLRPFFYAKPSDQWYNLLCSGKSELFWQSHQKKLQDRVLLTPSFQELIELVLCDDPAKRPRTYDIRGFKWMKEPGTMTLEEVNRDLQNRISILKARKEAEKAEKQAAAQRRAQAKPLLLGGPKLNPGPDGGPAPPSAKGMAPTKKRYVSEEVLEKIGVQDRLVDCIDPKDVRLSDYFCAFPFAEATEILLETLLERTKEVALSEQTFKVKATFFDEAEGTCMRVQVRVLCNDDETSYIRFDRLEGDWLGYQDLIDDLSRVLDKKCQ